MKIILASDLSFLLKYGYALTGIPKNQMKIGYITTSSKGARDKSFFENVKNVIRDNGYDFEEVDIESKTKEELRSFFKDKNIIHMEGGNTFYLLKAIRETGFAEILKDLLEEGRTYIGTSAGAYIMCPSVDVANWDKTGKSRFGIADFAALNHVSFVLKVHYTNEQEAKVREGMQTLKYPIRILKDGQGIFCEDGVCRFIGDEEEIKLYKNL